MAFSVVKAEAAKLPSVFWHPCFIAVLRGWGIFQGLDTTSSTLLCWKEEDYSGVEVQLPSSWLGALLFFGKSQRRQQ